MRHRTAIALAQSPLRHAISTAISSAHRSIMMAYSPLTPRTGLHLSAPIFYHPHLDRPRHPLPLTNCSVCIEYFSL